MPFSNAPYPNAVSYVAEFPYAEMESAATFAIHELLLDDATPYHPSVTAMAHHIMQDVLGVDGAPALQPKDPDAEQKPGSPAYLAAAVNEYLKKNGEAPEAVEGDFYPPAMNHLWGQDVDMHDVGSETMGSMLVGAGGRHFVAVGHGLDEYRRSLGHDPADHPTGNFLLAYANIQGGKAPYLNEFLVHQAEASEIGEDRLRRPAAALIYLATAGLTGHARLHASSALLKQRGDQIPEFLNFHKPQTTRETNEVYATQRLRQVRGFIRETIIDCEIEKLPPFRPNRGATS